MNKIPVITIDGPSGSGKGTVATLTAKDLGFRLLDSGALYRSLAVSAINREVNLEDHQQLADLARCLNIEFDLFNSGSVWLDGEDVSLSIRTDIVSKAASLLGTIPAVRAAVSYTHLTLPTILLV